MCSYGNSDTKLSGIVMLSLNELAAIASVTEICDRTTILSILCIMLCFCSHVISRNNL